jgi:site-specific recombinase XerD
MIYRFEALQTAVTVSASKGEKARVWLSPVEVKRLMARPGGDTIGQPDGLAMGLLAGAGLRRDEAANLAFTDPKKQPAKDKPRSLLQVQGKGARGGLFPSATTCQAD